MRRLGPVLQVVHGWPPHQLGGTELYVAALHRALLDRGVSSRVFAAGGPPGSDPAVEDSQGVCRVGVPPPTRFREGWTRPDVEALFSAWLARHRPQVVHVHHLAHLSTGLPALAARSGAAVVMTLHDYWLACGRGQLVDRHLRRCAGPAPHGCAACLGGQVALTPATAALGRRLAFLPGGARVALRELLGRTARTRGAEDAAARAVAVRRLVRHVHRFASPSADLARRMIRLGILPADRVQVVPLPLVQEVRPSPVPPPGPVRFLFLGALIPTKGPHLLLEAFARLPRGAATLEMAGPAPALDLFPGFGARLARRAGEVPGVRLSPPVPPGQVQGLLDRSDVLVVPSTWEENSPLVIREARAAGLRVLASHRGGMPELAPEAAWFDPDVPGALHRALAAQVRRGRGRDRPATWDRPSDHARRLEILYREVTRQTGAPPSG